MMRVFYSIFIVTLCILMVTLCPFEAWKEYIMFGLLVMMISINRWENDKILKTIEANTNTKSKALNIPDVSVTLPDTVKDSSYAKLVSRIIEHAKSAEYAPYQEKLLSFIVDELKNMADEIKGNEH